MQDTIVFMFMVLLRVGLPLAITIGAGYLIQRWLYRDIMMEAAETIEEGKIIPFERRAIGHEQPMAQDKVPVAPCWEVKGCPSDVREGCPAYPAWLRAGRPCWMTFQLADGKLHEECLNCEMFQLRVAVSDS